MRWPSFLTYGNWGGPGWSGGKYVDDPAKVDWTVEPVDEMDEAFSEHDHLYQFEECTRREADAFLLGAMLIVNVQGVWPNVYRCGVIAAFLLKLCFWRYKK